MKQINLLEEELDLKLFERKAHGIKLTPQGEQIYKDALFIKDYSVRALLEAKRLEESNHITFKIGTSLLNPAKMLLALLKLPLSTTAIKVSKRRLYIKLKIQNISQKKN